MNRHERCLGLAQDYFEDRLDGGHRAEWEAHRDSCPDCAAVLARWPGAAAVPNLAPAVLAALRPAPAPRAPGWLLPAASALALVLAATAFWHPERQWVRDDRDYGETCTQIQGQGGRPCCAE